MEQLIRQLISDAHEMPVPTGVERAVRIPDIEGKANVVVGMRRSGKTYLLFQEMRRLLREGVPRSHLVYFSFEDERLLEMRTEHLRLITEVYYRLFPDARNQRVNFFFDEMQNVPGWELFVRRLLDTENVRIYLSGSSSKLLSREVATAMRGRAIETRLLPFSLREVALCRGVEFSTDPNLVGRRLRSRLEHLCEEYLEIGGFPEVQGQPAFDRREVLQGYVDVVVLRDVVERYGVSNVGLLRRLIKQLLSAPACPFSAGKFRRDMLSQGLRCAKSTVLDYLAYLQDCFLVFGVEIHAESERRRQTNPRKVYPVDPGLASAYRRESRQPSGQLLETAVFLELQRRRHTVHYVRTSSGREVDFHAVDPEGRTELIQVCADPSAPETDAREHGALLEAMAELGHDRGTVVTLTHEETRTEDGLTVQYIPAWKWLIDRAQPR